MYVPNNSPISLTNPATGYTANFLLKDQVHITPLALLIIHLQVCCPLFVSFPRRVGSYDHFRAGFYSSQCSSQHNRSSIAINGISTWFPSITPLIYLASILTPNLLHRFSAACRVSPIASWLNSRIILVALLRVLIELLHPILFRASFQCFIGLILSLGTRLVPSVSYFN